MRCWAKPETFKAFGHGLQLEPLHHGKVATLQSLLQARQLLHDLLVLVLQGGKLGFHLLQAGLLDLGVCQGDERALHRLMGCLVIGEALQVSAQLPQAHQLLCRVGSSGEPGLEILQGLQHAH